ncbi:isopenicillin N synthase family dioxygenase [Pseudoponticoccus marisrubri]|uniref:2-oxoglutarate-dependent ethylene/succinate-forming enzyme n=1 Tax=Pseudoponticoccus marisrubri TaxID=1685382 RepID=A0A0W7WN03_9RHOB|nr:2-oxoglutarate and iron-dependent oxygenase domain-containing protein [Pseudoponticoccus marisrubri]KUF11970.1 oxidoreductase [Pseudoponticoccus marisrubri]
MGLPVIDISGLAASDPAARRAVGEALRTACLDHGFFYCTGHGVPQALMDAVMAQTRALFDLPDAAKDALDKAHSFCNRGYEQLGGQTLQPGAMPDRKEGYYISEEIAEGDPRMGRFNHGPNVWPQDLPEFRPVMMAYYAALGVVGARLMRGIALSLDLEEDALDPFTHRPIATLRLLHYPPARPEEPDELGAGAHTDFGALTLLMQDEVGGLQVKSDTGWIEAPPVPGAYVVNLGDMIARWTNDRYRSTLHRVINRSGRERYSVPFFYTGNPDYVTRCVPTCLAPGEVPKYPAVSVEAHLKAMYARTYAAAT